MAEREEFIIPEELLGEDEIILVDMVVEAVEQTVEIEVLGDDTEVDMVIVPDERILDMEVDDYVAGGGTPGGGILVETDPTVPAWAKQPEKPHYTASEVGADALGSANEALELAMSYTNQKVADIEMPTKTSQLENDSGYLTEHQSLEGYATEDWVEQQGYLTEHQSLEGYAKVEDIPTELPASDVYDWAKQPNKPTYTYSEVGADKSGSADGALDNAKKYTDQKIAAIPTPDVSGQINTHNTNTSAHNDIRLVVQTLTTKVNDLLDSDDETLDQMSEVVAYIKANRELLESVTINKVNVADIIDNLETNVANRPLSAAQGVVLKSLIDSLKIPTKLSELEDDVGFLKEHQSLDGYATEDWVNEQGYLKEHQSLDGYATEEFVQDKIEDVRSEIPSLEGYATEEYVNNKEVDLTGYATEKWVENKGYLTNIDKQEIIQEVISMLPLYDGEVVIT